MGVNELWSFYKPSQKLNSLKCRVEYSSMEILKTKSHWPFLHLTDCQGSSCQLGYYKCFEYQYCIPIRFICDGISQCMNGDDEVDCGFYFQI